MIKKILYSLLTLVILLGQLMTISQLVIAEEDARLPQQDVTTPKLKNVVKGKQPTTNSQTLIQSGHSTIPSTVIQNSERATDGEKRFSNNDDYNTKIVAGKEGGEDNGYPTWQPVYLQYDFGSVVPVSEIKIYRNTYDNALSTFKKVKVELSSTKEFTDGTTWVVFGEQDIEETVVTKGKPQVLMLEKPIEAQYIRIWGQGHYIQNTNSAWKGYSNGVLLNELEVMTAVNNDDDTSGPDQKLVNLAQLKLPYIYGQNPSNLQAINDGKFDENYAVNHSVGTGTYVQYEFKNAYVLKTIKLKLQPGEYKSITVYVDNIQTPKHQIYSETNKTIEKDTILTIPVEDDNEFSYVRFVTDRKDNAPVGYAEIEILGYGSSYDEKQTPYMERDTQYSQLVWQDEFDGQGIDESKWNIIEGMVNHAAIYNRKAVNIKKEGDDSYLSIRSTNYPSTQALIDAVGIDRYDTKPIPSKVTWSSGRVESKNKYSFQHGRIAVRAKVNDTKGIWPAIWMLAQDETGHDEIDILEYLGQNPWDAWTTNHYGILGKNKQQKGVLHKNYEAWSQAFHVFEIEWTPEEIRWYIDGKHVFTNFDGRDDGRDGTHTRPMFPILETQVGDGWVGDVDYTKNLTKQDSEYLVDWVRVYQVAGQDKVYFDDLETKAPTDNYHIQPQTTAGNLTAVSDGQAPHENKNHFFYGGQPRYETNRLYASDDKAENALIYKIDNPSALHLTTYYKTLEDAKEYNHQAYADKGESIRHHLKGSATIDFEVYSSKDGKNWAKENISIIDNFVDATPAYARTTFDVKQVTTGTKFVKIVFPTLHDKHYTLLNGQVQPIYAGDVQLAKVTFTAPEQKQDAPHPDIPNPTTTSRATTSKPTTTVKPTTTSTTKSTTTTKPTTKATTKPSVPKQKDTVKPVYRLYHEGLKVHLYTTSTNERDTLKKRGWRYEGEAWKTATKEGEPVHRLYHSGLRVHFYTKDANEYKVLGTRGWRKEGVAYRSHGDVKVYRLYHEGIKKHHYTKDVNEYNTLGKRGWRKEGIAWYSEK